MASKQDNTKLFKVTNLLKDSITNNIYSINKNIIKIELYYKLIDEYLKDSFVYLKKFSKEINNSFDKIKNQTHIKNSVFLDVLTALENFNYNNIKIIQLSKQLEELNKIIFLFQDKKVAQKNFLRSKNRIHQFKDLLCMNDQKKYMKFVLILQKLMNIQISL